jgi:hypothetical protein
MGGNICSYPLIVGLKDRRKISTQTSSCSAQTADGRGSVN